MPCNRHPAFLVGAWTNPLWKICSSKWESSPNRGENKKYEKKTPPRFCVFLLDGNDFLNLIHFKNPRLHLGKRRKTSVWYGKPSRWLLQQLDYWNINPWWQKVWWQTCKLGQNSLILSRHCVSVYCWSFFSESLDSKPHCLTQISTPKSAKLSNSAHVHQIAALTFDCTRQIESFRHFDFCYCSDIDVRARESLLKAFVAFISTRTSEQNDQWL